MAVGAYLLIVVVGLIAIEPYFNWQARGNETIAAHGKAYIRICMMFSLGQMIQWVFDRFLIATGRSSLFLITLPTASVVNLILDPILVFGYLGMPAMGTAGAAIATVTGQCARGIVAIIINLKKNKEIPIHFTLHISRTCVTKILKVGIPTAVLSGITSVVGVFINTVLYGVSSTAVVMTIILMSMELIPDKILLLFNASDNMMEASYDRLYKTDKFSVAFLCSSGGGFHSHRECIV